VVGKGKASKNTNITTFGVVYVLFSTLTSYPNVP
jgi:hypothetical protein